MFMFIYIFILKFIFLYSECEINTPILTQNGCQLKYCSQESFNSGECTVNNPIIKTQWLNDIILFNFDILRYGNFAINSKGDMIFECLTEETNGIRLFYWLNNDGSFYFENENGEKVPTKIFIVKDGDQLLRGYETQSIFISLNNDDKEYLLSISLYLGYVELYDLENNKVTFVSTINFTNYNIFSINSILLANNNGNSKEYLFTFIGQEKEDQEYNNFYLILQKYSFSKNTISLNDGYTVETKINKQLGRPIKMVSSFITDSNLIILFYLDDCTYILESYNNNYERLNSIEIDNIEFDFFEYEYLFHKAIYIKDNYGALIYYKESNAYLKVFYGDSLNIKFSSQVYNPGSGFITESPYNDLIKINNNKFCFISSTYDFNLYLIIFNFYNNDNNIKERVYRIFLYDLFNYILYGDLHTILYNNYLALSARVYNEYIIDFFSVLIIFGYVNGTNMYVNMSDFLSENNNEKNNNIIDKILENIKIDNNIFGYELLKEIKLISIPQVIKFENIENGVKIEVNNNEILKYEYEISLTNVPKLGNKNYYFEFQAIAQEPDLINQYPIYSTTINNVDNVNNGEEVQFEKK